MRKVLSDVFMRIAAGLIGAAQWLDPVELPPEARERVRATLMAAVVALRERREAEERGAT